MHKIPVDEFVDDNFVASISPQNMVYFLCNVGDGDAQLLLLPEDPETDERQAIIIDAGSHLSENTVTLLDAADKIVLVSSPDLAALHDVSRFTRISQSLAYPVEKVLLVMNRADRPGGIKTRDLKQVLHTGIFTQIPDDSINAIVKLINSPNPGVSHSPC